MCLRALKDAALQSPSLLSLIIRHEQAPYAQVGCVAFLERPTLKFTFVPLARNQSPTSA